MRWMALIVAALAACAAVRWTPDLIGWTYYGCAKHAAGPSHMKDCQVEAETRCAKIAQKPGCWVDGAWDAKLNRAW